MKAEIGIIGGSGFYAMEGFEAQETVRPDTPFGAPSDEIVIGQIGGVRVAFIARHGAGHRIPPDQLPSRANIFALKLLGVRTVVGVNAVGSLHIDYAPGHLALPDQLVDRTYGRPSSFFGSGLVAHVGFADPLCPGARGALATHAGHAATTVHDGGTLVVIQGPRFSTRAESAHYRRAGFELIGMTTLPEAILAREAELCYAALNVVTDYDVWHETEEAVTVDLVIRTLRRTLGQAQTLLAAAVPDLAARTDCACRHALRDAITTGPGAIDAATAKRLAPIVGRYLDAGS